MDTVNETVADGNEPGRYTARFAHQVWLGLASIAADIDAAVVSFTLEDDAEGGARATACLRTAAREAQYTVTLAPRPGGPSPDIAASLFVTAVEERLQAPGFKNPKAQIALAEARVSQRRNEVDDAEAADAVLAGALQSHATLLAARGRPEEALPLLDEAIDHYTRLAATDPDTFGHDLERTRGLREQCRP